jgi:hypothetical protein
MGQPIPKVSDKDVERIAIRDFGKDKLSEVMSILKEYGEQDWNRPGSPRVRLAILKLADGDWDQLSRQVKIAIQDYRDVLTMAEYPRWTKEIGFEKANKKIEHEIIDDDWRQYTQWLEKE